LQKLLISSQQAAAEANLHVIQSLINNNNNNNNNNELHFYWAYEIYRIDRSPAFEYFMCGIINEKENFFYLFVSIL
jgi:hypothetical protein